MFLHNSIKIIEPLWWQQLMVTLNSWVIKHDLLVKLLPWTADIFVFTYPVYLVGLYLRWIHKEKDYYKHASFAFAFSAWLASILNSFIQYFGDKVRPETMIALKSNLLLDHLPTDPFPSDHAAVSTAIAMSTLLWWIKYKDKHLLRMSLFFWIASGMMCFSRVAVAIHWPTDILVGILIGILSALVVLRGCIRSWIVRRICTPLIRLQQRIWTAVWW